MGDFQQLDIFYRQLVVCGRKHTYVDLDLWLISRRYFSCRQFCLKGYIRRPLITLKLQPVIFSLFQHVIRFHELPADTTQRFLQRDSSYYA